MNNQEKNTYVRSQILAALLKMMQEQPFSRYFHQRLGKRSTSRQSVLLPQFYG